MGSLTALRLRFVSNPDSCRILDRLAEIGWREEAEKITNQSSYGWDEFTTHKLVKQTKKLTEYGDTLALFSIYSLTLYLHKAGIASSPDW